MALPDIVHDLIAKNGWLSISSLYFDNAYTMRIYASRGYVAYSPGQGFYFCTNCIDTTDTQMVENTYNILDNRFFIGQQQVITVLEEECLQHFDLALYTNYRHYFDEQEKFPIPTYPTKDEIMAMVVDPETNLVEGIDTAHLLGDRIADIDVLESNKNIYPDNPELPYSGAWVRYWQRFYKNQAKFIEAVGTIFGVADCV